MAAVGCDSTQDEYNPPGTNARIGSMLILYAHIAPPTGPAKWGDDAPLCVWLFNQGQRPDRLLGAKTTRARSVDIVTAEGSTRGPVDVPRRQAGRAEQRAATPAAARATRATAGRRLCVGDSALPTGRGGSPPGARGAVDLCGRGHHQGAGTRLPLAKFLTGESCTSRSKLCAGAPRTAHSSASPPRRRRRHNHFTRIPTPATDR